MQENNILEGAGESSVAELSPKTNCCPPDFPSNQQQPSKIERKKYYVKCPCCAPFHVMNEHVDGVEYHPTVLEELANIVTHLVPALIAFFLLPDILSKRVNNTMEQLSVSLYGTGFIILFSVSSLYHVTGLIFGKESKVNQWFLKLDMTTIFAFVSATATPWCLLVEVGPENMFGKMVLTILYLIGALGTIKNLTGALPNFPSLLVYISMASTGLLWVVLLGYLHLFTDHCDSKLHVWAFAEEALGCVVYFLGTLIYSQDGRIPFAHAIWHMFVTAAACIHMHSFYEFLLTIV